MTSKNHLITKWIELANFIDTLEMCKEIEMTQHARMRLASECKGADEDVIRELIMHNLPEKIGLQSNGLYALFYKKNKEEYTKIIVHILSTKIFIVTFHNIIKQELPRLK